MASLKQVMKWLGVDCGRNRRPFKCLSAEEAESLKSDLIELKKTKALRGVKLLDCIE